MLGVWYTIDVFVYFFGHLATLPVAKNVPINLPHILIFIAAYYIALRVDKPKTGAAPA